MVPRYKWYFDSVRTIYNAGALRCPLLSVFMIVVAIRYREYADGPELFFIMKISSGN